MRKPITYVIAAAVLVLLAVLAYRVAMNVQRGDLPAGDAAPVAGAAI
jgi:hypothetical protein